MLKQWIEYYRIKQSGLFNQAYYLLHNTDIRNAGVDPLMHFVKQGWREGRNPCWMFDTNFYLKMNPEVRQAGINPLIHYLQFGGFEGRDPGPNFCSSYYLNSYPKVKITGINPLVHYFRFGIFEECAAQPDQIQAVSKSYLLSKEHNLQSWHKRTRRFLEYKIKSIVKRNNPGGTNIYFCNICGWKGEKFIGAPHPQSSLCPMCGHDSQARMFFETFLVYLRENCSVNKAFLLDDTRIPYRVLEKGFHSNHGDYAKRMTEICEQYIDHNDSPSRLTSANLNDQQGSVIDDHSIDFVLYHHGLECAVDDVGIYAGGSRILKNRGAAFFQMPIKNLNTSVEKSSETNAILKRNNGWDVVNKMKVSGFDVKILVCDELFLCFESIPSRDFSLYDQVSFYEKYGQHNEASRNYPFINLIPLEQQINLYIYPFGAHEVFLCQKIN